MHKKYIYAWKCGLNCIFTDFSCGAHFFVLGAPAPLYPEVLFERMAQVVAVEVRIDFGGEDAFVIASILAVLKCGGRYVPAEPDFPTGRPSLLSMAAIGFNNAVLSEAGMSFLGIGVHIAMAFVLGV